jgi:hypothetical protein
LVQNRIIFKITLVDSSDPDTLDKLRIESLAPILGNLRLAILDLTQAYFGQKV